MPPVSNFDIKSLYNFIHPLAIQAGEIFLEGYNSIEKNIEIKGFYYDMVTKYDVKIENFLRDNINLKYPNHKFIGEEDTSKKNDIINELTDEPTWIIDPIDGTSNFCKKLPHTCISIGLSINKEIVLGIVNNPVLNELYTAIRGQGAFLNGNPIKASNCEKVTNAIIGYEVSLLHAKGIEQKHIKRIFQLGCKATRLVSYGSVVQSMCYVASGSLDAYHIEDMYPWDSAAASILIEEAGGIIKSTCGGKYDIMKPKLICAGTKSLCEDMIKIIQDADKMNDLV